MFWGYERPVLLILTALKIKTAKPAERAYKLADAGGLFLLVQPNGSKLWRRSAGAPGAALGDETVPGIGERPIALVRPHERTTPAGRFAAEPGHDARGEDVVWVDYDAAVSMHRVITTDPAERRLQRLASPTARDHRSSYGCIPMCRWRFTSHISDRLSPVAGITPVS